MKLELVMLATVFSMITERQVEAQLNCYENKYYQGLKKTISNSIPNITSLLPKGSKSCDFPAKSVLIFYSEPEYRGNIIAVSGNDRRISFREPFTAKSILMLRDQTVDKTLLLFKEKDFQGGVFQSFNLKTKNVGGIITFGSAIVFGETLDWTAVGRCGLVDSNGQCLVCLRWGKSGASFIRRIASTGMWGTEAIFPGACAGTNYAGESIIRGDVLKCYSCNIHHSKDVNDLTNCPLVETGRTGLPCVTCGIADDTSMIDYLPYTARFCEEWIHETKHKKVTDGWMCYCKPKGCNKNMDLCKSLTNFTRYK